MRLSCRKNHPDYDQLQAHKAIVYLNEEKLKGCVFADEEKGIAEVYQTDSKGNFRVDKENGCVKTKILVGKVEIRIAD